MIRICGLQVIHLVVFGALSVAKPVWAGQVLLTPDECKALTNQLQSIERNYRLLTIHDELLSDYMKERAKLLDETWWQRSDAAAIPATIKALADGTLEAAGMAAGPLGKTVAGTYSVLDVIVDARANGLPAKKVAETVVKALAVMAASAEWKPIVEGTGLLYTKVDGGISLVKDQQAREALRATVAGEIMRIDEAIAKVRAAQIKILARGDASFPAKAAVESLLREAKCSG